MNTPDKPAEQTIKNAQQQIVNEMFKDGWEAGNRIWDDENHPLKQAFVILLRAHCQLPSTIEKAVAFMEEHRRMEEGPEASQWRKTVGP
jgi:hypothetical protein